MAEALAIVGLVSSIVQFVDFSSKIVHRLKEFHSSLDKAPTAFRDVTIDLPLLVDTLERTKKQTEEGCFSGNTQEAIRSVVEGCRSQVERLNDVLEEILPTKGDSLLKRHKKAFSSISQEKKIQQITTNFRNYVQTLTYHQTTSTSIGDKRKQIHQWLSAPDPWLNYNKALKERQAGTGTWFIKSKQYADWKTNLDSFLWLYGIPGCGKTILSSTIIEDALYHCHRNRSMAVIYFYFDFNDVEKQQYEKMLCSLIIQLSLRCLSTPKVLAVLFSSCMHGKRQPTSDVLLTTLQQMIWEFEEIFIVLDALDECKERQELLKDIGKISRWKMRKLHILTTSRREKDINEQFDSLVNDERKVCIQSEFVNDDIRAYIQKRLQGDENLKRWRNKPEVQQEIETSLMSKAGGMFRWAVCQLDALGKCLNLPRLRSALRQLPDTLDGIYDRILCAIDKEYSQDALKILQWLVYSARPLRIDEVVDAIAVSNDGDPQFDPENRLPDPQDILIICSSLVTIAGVEIRLAHFSVKEYLVSKRIQNGLACQYSIRSMPANLSIAETCLAYLLQLDAATFLTFQTIEEFPLAKYAARYWTQHAQAAGEDAGAIHQLVMQLFRSEIDVDVNWVWLLDPDWAGQEPNATEDLKRAASPLHYISLAGLTESVRLLLENGADVNAQGGRYETALHAASARGHDQVVKRLLDAGANVNTQGGLGGTALQVAAAYGHHRVVQLLLKNGAGVNVQGGEFGNALQAASYGKFKDSNKLQEVSAKGSAYVVQCLLENGANINAQGGRYSTGLQAAAARGCKQVVQLLLENGADVNIKGGHHGTALHAAAAKGHGQVVQLLLDNGADVNSHRGRDGTALQAAAANGHGQVVELLLQNGADVNAQGGRDGTPLYAALIKGHEQIVHRLLGNGADANAPGGEFYGNALQAASAKGSIKVVQWLLAKGASINAQSGDYGTALQAAAYKGYDAVVQLLLDEGAEVNAQGGQYGNALQAASHGGHEAVVQKLLNKGAVVNGRSREYADALQAAVYNGKHALVQMLTEIGISDNVQSDTHIDEIPVLHDHRWLRGKIWIGDHQFTGQLLLTRYIATTATIEVFPLIAKHDSASIPFSLDPSVMVGSFSPNIELQEEPEIRLGPEAGYGGHGEILQPYSSQGDSRALFRVCALPTEQQYPSVTLWPPMTIPIAERTRIVSSQGLGEHELQNGRNFSEELFRLKLGSKVETFAAINPKLFTPDARHPFRGIWIGDYKGHEGRVCEFILFHQPTETRLEAIKITGDRYVPRGEYTFIVDDLSNTQRVCSENEWPGARAVGSKSQIATLGFENSSFSPCCLWIPSADSFFT